MSDFAESIGKFTVGLEQNTVDMIANIADSSKQIAEMQKQAGESNENMLRSMRELSQVFMAMTTGLQLYKDLTNDVKNNARELLNINKELLDKQEARVSTERKITDEIRGQTAAGSASQLTGTAEKAMADPTTFALQQAGSLAQGTWAEGAAKAATVAAIIVANELKTGKQWASEIERTSGKIGGLSMGETAKLDLITKFAASGLHYETGGMPFATREQITGAAGTLYGLGGIRGKEGGDLNAILSELPKKAYEFGMGLDDAARMIAKLSRVQPGQTPEQLMSTFDAIAKYSRDSGEKAAEFGKYVAEAGVSVHAYGMTQNEVNSIIFSNYTLIKEEKMTREDMNSILKEGARLGLSDKAVNQFIKELGTTAGNTGQKVGDILPAAMSLEKAFVSISHNSTASFYEANSTMSKFAEALKKDISEGTLTKMVDYLVSGVGATRAEMEDLATGFVKLGKETHVSSDKIASWHEQMTTGTREMFDDPKEAAWVAGSSLRDTAKMFDQGKVTVGDWTSVVKTQMDILGDSGTGATGQFVKLSKIVENTNLRMSELSQWTAELSKSNLQFGINTGVSNSMLTAFGESLRNGSVSMQDMIGVLKGPAGAPDAMKAMVASQLASSGGAIGKAFGNAGVLGGIDVLLPDLQRWAETGKTTGALTNAFGADMGGLNQADVKKQLGGTFSSILTMLSGSSDLSSASSQSMLMRLSPMLLGTDLTKMFGPDRENMLKVALGQADPTKLGAEHMRGDVKKTEKDLVSAYGKFPQHIDKFGGAAKTIAVASTTMDNAAKKMFTAAEYLNTKMFPFAPKRGMDPNTLSGEPPPPLEQPKAGEVTDLYGG